MFNFMRVIDFEITNKYNGWQIRDFLRDFGVSSALLTKLKQTDNGITVNGEFARAIDHLHTGDLLKIRIESKGKMPTPLHSDRVEVVYQDEDILVLNKPAFMPVHESRNHRGDTLANVAACYIDEDNSFRAVYRLDRDTSGLVLIAKNELAASKLAGKIDKDYYAICSGVIEGSGTIDLPIRRVAESIIVRGVFDDGERAVTSFTAIESIDNMTLLRLNLETGRTHQIRVHLTHLGHPLIGDSLYGGDCSKLDRQALHCKAIRFTHPITNEEMTLECDFPSDFKDILGE